jgi:SAM-dependent methyltransferase
MSTADSELERLQTRFAEPGYLFGTAPNVFLKSKAQLLHPGERVLAIADGEGRNGVFLAERGLNVLSVDFSPVAQAKARRVTLRFEQADMTNWCWPEATFDMVAATFFQFTKPPERAKMFADIKRTLKSGGLPFLLGYGLKQLDYKTGGPSDPMQLYTRALLEDAFGDFPRSTSGNTTATSRKAAAMPDGRRCRFSGKEADFVIAGRH